MQNYRTRLALVTFVSTVCIASSFAFAADERKTGTSNTTAPHPVASDFEYKPHVGAQLGIANPEGAYDTGVEYSLDVGIQPYVPFGVGLELGRTDAKSRTSAENLSRNLLLVKGSYNFSGENYFVKHSYVGLGIGTSFGTGGDLLVWAPLAGFDIPIGRFFEGTRTVTLGALGKYLIYEGTNADSLAIDAMVKYWF